ncbi:AfsR/SARP family transcriptional regulator [Nonomuraea angiospora]|uniref:AfsR/SARP family transcriptional regulator n=1 Tax=Nonomuraea angiospora TaxID=46172 RepID=UPI00341E741B
MRAPVRSTRPVQTPARYAVRLLGRFTVTRDGVPLAAMWPKPSTLLALLLVSQGPLPHEHITAELWPSGGPASALANLRTYVTVLRRHLGGRAVRTWAGAYELALPGARLDETRFRALMACAEGAATAGEQAHALQQALALWRGPALGGIARGPALDSWAERVDGHRRRAVHRLAELWLRAGRHATAQDLLRTHLLASPTDETASRLLMWALYQAGDSEAALAEYRRAASLLMRGGLLPGPLLRGAQEAILNHRLPADLRPAQDKAW